VDENDGSCGRCVGARNLLCFVLGDAGRPFGVCARSSSRAYSTPPRASEAAIVTASGA